MTSASAQTILLTIDVEDWFQVENLRPWYPQSVWDHQSLRVVRNTNRLLDLFDGLPGIQIKATFFILGWVAEKAPELVREISKRGHEVASHGFNHLMCRQMEPGALEQDLIRSKAFLEDIIGQEIRGYRAPSFSINNNVLKSIQSVGYRYDSSYNNFGKHGRYGQISVNGCDTKGVAICLDNGLVELPISNLLLRKMVIPWGGGGYFRFIPFPLYVSGVNKILKNNDAFVFYLHPWEIDPDQPRANAVKGLKGWRHYLNLDKTYVRLKKMIMSFDGYRFLTCSQYLNRLELIHPNP